MSCCCSTFWAIGLVTILSYFVKKVYSCLFDIPEVPKVDENYWWGPGAPSSTVDTSIKPFKISVSDKDLADLKQRLSNARPFTPPLEGIQHEYGFNTDLLKEIKEFWNDKYDWRERETFLNQYPQYTTKIQGLDITFLHIKPEETKGLKVVPLLLVHGWPGSVREFYETIPHLTRPSTGRKFIFEVVVPYLPGYGFSEAAARPGLSSVAISVVFKNLMKRLQFDQWYLQGGDWGSVVVTQMAILFPKNILGVHLNMAITRSPISILKLVLGSIFPSLIVGEKHRSKIYPLKRYFLRLIAESGYLHIQATKPDTLGVALNESPIGLAAYILEKFIAGTNFEYISRKDGGLTQKFNYATLLDNVMIYWITRSFTTSARLYAESFGISTGATMKQLERIPVEVPSAYAHFGNDGLFTPKTLLTQKFKKLLQYSELPTGGHFAALEEPEMFAEDVWSAVQIFEDYHVK